MKKPGNFGAPVSRGRGEASGSMDARWARNEEEAILISTREKAKRKRGRREQKEQEDREKITLPRLKFLEKDPG